MIIECNYCQAKFDKPNNMINQSKKRNQKIYCSKKCHNESMIVSEIILCTNCNKQVSKLPRDKRRTKSGNLFCNKSCAATYNNKHKTHGTRVSKLEKYIQKCLQVKYPKLLMLFNEKTAINSELDIYIPQINLAFELNGIFHYEPIFGEDKLNQIHNNDQRKFQACLEQNIELCTIDTSQQKYFKESTSQKYLDIITSIIDSKIN